MSEPIGNTEQLPVAWMTENGTIFDELPPISSGLIPLYAHPMRELSDDEIINTLDKICYEGDSGCVTGSVTIFHQIIVNFARAIIKANRGEK